MTTRAQSRFRSSLCDILDIQYPIMLAGMGGVSVPELAAAVSNAGGIGILGAAGCSPDQLDEWIRRTRQLTDKPFGVDTVLPSTVPEGGAASELRSMISQDYWDFVRDFMQRHNLPLDELEKGQGMPWTADFFDKQLEVVIENNVPVYAAGLGNPAKYLDALHAHGTKVIGVVGAVKHAVRDAGSGVDLLVAQGHDAGGHNSRIGTMALIPQVVDAVEGRVPIVAAGGIASGRQIVAALVLGAIGVWMGSRFLVAEEANIPRFQKEQLLTAGEDDTVVTKTLTGKPARLLKNAWTEEFEASGLKPLPTPLQSFISNPVMAAATKVQDTSISVTAVSQTAGMLHKIQPAGEIVAELVSEVEQLLEEQPWLHR